MEWLQRPQRQLRDHFRQAAKLLVELIKLPAGKYISTHVDVGMNFKLSNRIHITNDKCIFVVGNEGKQMKRGEIWEINNDMKPHSVHNSGTEDRIHLLIDYKKLKV